MERPVPSLRTRIIRRSLQGITAAINVRLSVQEQRTRLDELSRRGMRTPRGVTVRTVQVGKIHAEWIEPANATSQNIILYLHGGGYCIGSLDTHRGLTARLAMASQARLLNIEYRLAPENPFPAALEDALAAYKWLLDQGIPAGQIAIGGDSAGGGLTLATAVSARDESLPLPAALFLLSPWTDLTFSGESHRSRKEVDPMFGGENGSLDFAPAYLGGHDPGNPLISPLFADLHGLPCTLIHVGNDEILLDDSTRLEEKMKAAGGDARLEVWEGLWHVFQVFAPFVPEAQISINGIGKFIQDTIQGDLA